jgi:hypothetical protein
VKPLRAALPLVVALLAGCSSRSGSTDGSVAAAKPAPVGTPAPAPGPIAGAIARVPGQELHIESQAVTDTPWTVERPDPHVGYGSFERARDRLEQIVRHQLGAYAESAQWRRGEIEFTYRDRMELNRPAKGTPYWSVEDRLAPSRVPGLAMTLETVSEGSPDVASISQALVAEGWVEDTVFSADGPDGTSFSYVCRDALCRVEAQWEGGDDSDTLAVPSPGIHVDLVCVPRVPGP